MQGASALDAFYLISVERARLLAAAAASKRNAKANI
jgi:hypothetical protein